MCRPHSGCFTMTPGPESFYLVNSVSNSRAPTFMNSRVLVKSYPFIYAEGLYKIEKRALAYYPSGSAVYTYVMMLTKIDASSYLHCNVILLLLIYLPYTWIICQCPSPSVRVINWNQLISGSEAAIRRLLALDALVAWYFSARNDCIPRFFTCFKEDLGSASLFRTWVRLF